MILNQEQGPIYVIQQGDTLNEIAIRFGLSAEEILTANPNIDPNFLFIGQNIIIPGLEGISGVLTSEVLPLGTSLTGLTRQYRLNQSDLIVLNRLTSPSEMIAGVSIIVPIIEAQQQMVPLPTQLPGASPLETAIRSGTSPWMLVHDNQLKATWDVLDGETLFSASASELDNGNPREFFQISMNTLPLIQGETLQIKVLTQIPMEIDGNFNGEPLIFFEEEGTYYNFHGIHVMAEPGVFPLRINAAGADGSQVSFEQLVLLSPGYYGNQWVYVGEEYLDQAIIDEENTYVTPILNRSTPTRHWEGGFQYPIDEPCVNSIFGIRRNYNDGELFFYHTGMDFAVCTSNLNIYAPAAGEVVLAEELAIRGKAILIDHGWGVFSGYWHLSEFNVSLGDFVQPGDLLGLIGNTGRSAGPHLHFEINVSGTPVNPQTWLDQTFP